MRIEELERWLRVSSPGDRLCYHEGLLMADREEDPVLDVVAQRMWWEAKFTRGVELVQQRVKEGVCRYYAVRRKVRGGQS